MEEERLVGLRDGAPFWLAIVCEDDEATFGEE